MYAGDLNEHGNSNEWKPVMHGDKQLHGGDVNENENLTGDTIYFIFWDRRINVIIFIHSPTLIS